MKDNLFLAKGINISCSTIDGISYIYVENEDELLKLDEVGSFIWCQINGKKTVREIVNYCLSEYTGDEKEIIEHVKSFIGMLLKEKILVSSSHIFKGVMQYG